jgi:hypothetical protein
LWSSICSKSAWSKIFAHAMLPSRISFALIWSWIGL